MVTPHGRSEIRWPLGRSTCPDMKNGCGPFAQDRYSEILWRFLRGRGERELNTLPTKNAVSFRKSQLDEF